MTEKKDIYITGSSILKENWVRKGGINTAPIPEKRPIPLGISGTRNISLIDKEKKQLVKTRKLSKAKIK